MWPIYFDHTSFDCMYLTQCHNQQQVVAIPVCAANLFVNLGMPNTALLLILCVYIAIVKYKHWKYKYAYIKVNSILLRLSVSYRQL